MRSFFRAYWLPILSALLVGTSYIPFPPVTLLFCLVPLWLFLQKVTSVRQAFWGGWITQFGAMLIGFHWIAHTAIEFGHLPVWVGALALLSFASLINIYFAFAAALWFWVKSRWPMKPWASWLLIGALLALGQMTFPALFPWHFGYPWIWGRLPGYQIADWVGFEGLNILTIFINTLLAWGISQLKTEPEEAVKKISTGIAIFIAVNILGLWHKHAFDKTDSELRFLAIQGNIGNFEKIVAEKGHGFRGHITNKFISLTRQALQEKPGTDQIIVWPETAFPARLNNEFAFEPENAQVRNFIREIHHPLLTGSYSEIGHVPYNGIFFIENDGQAPQPPYHKTILLAFGEYLPFSQYFPWMLKALNMGEFGRGHGPQVMNYQGFKLGPQICYEGLYDTFAAGLAEQGADVFVNVTNDSWFGTDFEPYQHLYMTLARAIEFRRPLVRVTNTGISTGILARGDILAQSPLHKEWTGEFVVPFKTNAPHTFYEKWAGLWPWILFAWALFLIGVGRERKK